MSEHEQFSEMKFNPKPHESGDVLVWISTAILEAVSKPFNIWRIRKICEGLELELDFAPVSVGEGQGMLTILDGNHKVAVARMIRQEKMLCSVTESMRDKLVALEMAVDYTDPGGDAA